VVSSKLAGNVAPLRPDRELLVVICPPLTAMLS